MTVELSKTVHRYEVPVDDQTHTIRLTSNPHAVAVTRPLGRGYVMEFWTQFHGEEYAIARSFRVYGTGHPIPDAAKWWGTAARVDGLVWHLFELPSESGEAL